ncbi:MAG: sterol desaturase family protein [Bdellovibrionales bacterium]|nr:sterol desaturase family protein [Bdellovibrionales bacterium]
MIMWWGVFWLSFAVMEFNAWVLHKYVMHGVLWFLHEDHHAPVAGHSYQLNDFFAIFFAVPSFMFILFDSLYNLPMLGAIGYGVMAYGAVYFTVHEVIIHRRWKFFHVRDNWYVEALKVAHKVHHSVQGKYGCRNFGMLVVAPQYYRAALRRRRKFE